MKAETKYKKKLKEIKKLAKSAMTDTPVWKPYTGYNYIKNIDIGELVELETGTRAIVLDTNEVSVTVLVTSVDQMPSEDRPFYLGKHRWACETEVKLIK